MIYLDHAATAPPRREVLEAMWPHLTTQFANPASHHEPGEQARRALDEARRSVATSLGVRASEVVFTSGGTEADNAAVKGIAVAAPRGRHVLVSAAEHAAVLESAAWLARHEGFEVELLPVTRDGMVTVDVLADRLRDDTTLVSVILANNEVGTVSPVADLAALAAERSVPFHTDAVQAVGWVDLTGLGVQALSLSGHKFGTPKGMGVLVLRGGVPFEPILHGGGHQGGRRSGTENVAAGVAMATALRLPAPDVDAVRRRRDAFIARVLATGAAELTGSAEHRLAGHASFVFPGRSGESVLIDLERRGVICSSGSACAAGSDEPSHVLMAMGYDREVAQTAVRFSFGARTPDADLTVAADALTDILG